LPERRRRRRPSRVVKYSKLVDKLQKERHAEAAVARTVRADRPAHRRNPRDGLRGQLHDAPTDRRSRAGRGVGDRAPRGGGDDACLRHRPLALRQRRLEDGRLDGSAGRDRSVRGRGRAVFVVGRGRRALGRGDPVLPRALHPGPLRPPASPGPRRLDAAAARGLPGATRRRGGYGRRHGRRRLGTDRHVVAALIRTARATQGRRVDRHVRVPGHHRRASWCRSPSPRSTSRGWQRC
jgi:hypothetical protein